MDNTKPPIAILLAVYEPRLDWLQEQLLSLNRQTYPNLRLYVREDCSPTVPFAEIAECVRRCITAFPYALSRNARNMGSNLTFQRLTEEAEGTYFAYCDQDDIWLPEKLCVLQEEMRRTGALLACSDMRVIDGEGKRTADSITQVRRHHTFRSGEGLAEGLIFRNFVTGCTVLVQAGAAKEAVPFCPYMVHDHYLALYCAERGTVRSLPQPLICYRIHSGNQTSLLGGVTDKRSYGAVRITAMRLRLEWLDEHFPCGEAVKRALRRGLIWSRARERNWRRGGGKREIWRYRRFSLLPSLFELFAAELPEGLFRLCVTVGKRNLI